MKRKELGSSASFSLETWSEEEQRSGLILKTRTRGCRGDDCLELCKVTGDLVRVEA